MTKQPECTPHCNFEHAVRVRRAFMICADCGRDLGIEYFFWAKAAHPEWFESTHHDPDPHVTPRDVDL